MITLTRTDSENQDFIELIKQLDGELAGRDGPEHAFYAPFNKVDKIKHVIVAYVDGQPVGCGALKEYGPGIMEIKRMYTSPPSRGNGIATRVLAELEKWAVGLSFKTCILETGKRQPEAIGLYKKNGYQIISNYGQYARKENSVCFQKELKSPVGTA